MVDLVMKELNMPTAKLNSRTHTNLVEFSRLYKSHIGTAQQQKEYEKYYYRVLNYLGISRKETNSGIVYRIVQAILNKK